MTLAGKILRSSALNMVEYFVRVGSILVVTPMMAHHLGLANYGIWLTLTAIIAWMNVLDGGVTLSGTHLLARTIGSAGDPNAYVHTISSLRWIYQRVGFACLVATALLMVALSLFIKDEASLYTSRFVVGALGGSMSIRFFLRLHLVKLKSHVRYDLIVIASLAKIFVQTTLVLALLMNARGLVEIAAAQFLSEIVDQVLVVSFSRRQMRIDYPLPPHDPKQVRAILKYSGLTLLNTLGQTMRNRMDPFVLTAFVSAASVPVYSMGKGLITMYADLVNAALGGTLLAGFSQVTGRDGLIGVREKFFTALKFSVPMAMLGAACLFTFGPSFLERWLGPAFVPSGQVLRILVLPYALWLMQFPSMPLLMSLNQHHVAAWLTFAAGAISVVLNIIMAAWIGFYGVVWATFAEMSLFYGIVMPLLVSYALKMPVLAYLRRALLRPVLVLGPLIVLCSAGLVPVLRADYGVLALASLALTLTTGLAFWQLLLSPDERTSMIARIRRSP